jgi:hypothetical protein
MKPVMTSPSLSELDDRDFVHVDLGHVLRRHPRAFIVEVRQFGSRREIIGDRHGERRPVLRRDFTDRVLAQIHARLRVGAGNEVFRHRFRQPLGNDPLCRRVCFRQRQLRGWRRLLRLRGADDKQRCRRRNRE